MIIREVFAVLARRWYVVVTVVVSAVLLIGVMGSAREVYWTQVDLVFLPPSRPNEPGNALEGSDESLVFFAAAVEKMVNAGHPPLILASPEATLYGAGVERGSSIVLPNAGGQWQTNFNQAVLTVQVVDVSLPAAQERLRDTLAKVRHVVESRQEMAGVRTSAAIRVQASPEEPQFILVTGSRKRAILGMLVLTTGVAVAGSLLTDRMMTPTRRRRVAAGEGATRCHAT
jgi:hypothetical protein